MSFQSRYYLRLSTKRFISVAPDMTVLYYGVKSREMLAESALFFCLFLLLNSVVDTRSPFFWLPLALSVLSAFLLHAFFYVKNRAHYPLITPRDL